MEDNWKYSSEMLFDMYQKMLRIRKFEERASECFKKGIVAGNLHLCVGQILLHQLIEAMGTV